MTQRNRKLVGSFLLIASLVAWGSLGTSIYLAFPPDLPWWVLIGYFVVAGMGWLLPSMWIIRFMARPDA